MEIVCPNCSSAYRLAAGAIGPEGRKVRCARCGQEWLATRTFAQPAMEYAILPPGTDAALSASFADALLTEEEAPRQAARAAAAGARVQPRPPRRRPPPRPEPIAAAWEDDEPEDFEPLSAPEEREELTPPRLEAQLPVPVEPVTISAIGPGFERIRKAAATVSRPPKRKPARRRPLTERLGIPALGLVVLLVAGAVFARQPIVAAMPDLAGLYALIGLDVNLRGLEFRNMTATRDIENGRPVLIVKGEIANVASSDNPVPPIRLALRSGRQEIYAWSVESPRRALAAGETAQFSTRLPTPPPGASDIEIRFTRPQRIAVGLD
jgi:predicted Zn finger-like uncharacterized protein